MAQTIKYILTVDSKGAVKSVRTADGEVRKLEKHVDDVGKAGKRMGRVFEVAMGNLAANAVAGLTRAVGNLARNGFRLLAKSVELRGIQQIAERKLEQALKNLGGGAEEAAPRLFKVAAELQKVSNFGDETIITAQAMLATFKDVAGPEGIEILTSRMLDMAAGVAKVTGESVDLNQIAAMLGKSLSDSASVLKRVGVSLTDAEMAALNAATGLEKVNLLANVLDANFKGLAQTVADPFKQMQNAAGDLLEEIGKGLRPELENLAKEIQELIESGDVRQLAQEIGTDLGNAIRGVVEFLVANKDTWKDLGSEFAQLGEHSADLVALLTGDDSVESGLDAVAKVAGNLAEQIEWVNDAVGLFLRFADPFADSFHRAVSAGASLFNSDPGQVPGVPVGPPSQADLMTGPPGAPPRPPAAPPPSAPRSSGKPGVQPRTIAATKDPDEVANLLGPGTDFQAEFDLFQMVIDTSLVAEKQTDKAAEALGRYGELLMANTEQAIFNKEAEEARLVALQESITAQLAAADTSIESAADIANATLAGVRQVIQAKLAELIARNLASLGPAALFVGPLIAASMNALFNKLIPKFADGVTNFSGGMALVGERGPELVTLPGGSNVITNENTQKLMGGGNLAREVRLMRVALEQKQFLLRGTDLETAGKRQRGLYARAGIK